MKVKFVKESLNFNREGDPLEKMGIGTFRNMTSKMADDCYIPIYQDDKWSIEKFLNPRTKEYNLVIINDELGRVEWPIMYDKGEICYDNPEIIPEKIKKLISKFYNKIRS